MMLSLRAEAAAARPRARELYREQIRDLQTRTDRMFGILMAFQWVAGIIAATTLSPVTWRGVISETHIHVWAAILFGGLITAYPIYLIWRHPGERATRMTIAVGQMLTSALLIHLTGGRIETHFHVFGSLAFLAFYRDRGVLITASCVIVADHLLRGALWPQSVFGVANAPLWRPFEHGGWVAFELAFLLVATRQGLRELWGIADRQARMEETQGSIEGEVRARTVELSQTGARMRAIVETAADGILSIAPNGRIETFNPAAERIFGRRAPDVLGQGVSLLVPAPKDAPTTGAAPDSGWAGVRHEEWQPGAREIIGRRADGTTFPMDLSVSEDGHGAIICVVRDITERRAIDRMKTEFISTVSHELRTPLTSIRGSLGLLKGGIAGSLPESGRTLLDIALNNSERLVRLVNDILDIEKIESGRIHFRRDPHDLIVLVRSAVEGIRGLSDQLGVHVASVPEVAAAPVTCDADRVIQVLTNLLSNALKYSPRGETVRVRLRRADGRFRVEVEDRGPGIPEEFRGRIFGKFAQADSSDRRQKGGTGLGLSIAKSIVEGHGGRIGFESAVGKGSTFHFELPSNSVEARGPLAAAPHECRTSGGGSAPHVLVVEDEPDIAKLLRLLLEQSGYSVEVAATAEQAKARLAAREFDAMTLDLMLPGASGVDLLRELRRAPDTVDLPVVVVSAKVAEGKDELAGEAIDVIDWLEKPIDEERLFAAVRRAADRVPKRHAEPAGEGRVLHVEDDADLHHVVRQLLESVCALDHAPNLAEAHRLIAQRLYDLVLLDLDLPDGSGLSVARALGDCEPPVPVVIFSGIDPEPEALERAAAALIKSQTSTEKLIATIRMLLPRHDRVGSPAALERSETT